MHKPRKTISNRSYRCLGIERLEDRRVLSGASLIGPLPAVGLPPAPALTSTPTAGSAVATPLSSAQLAAETTVGQSINAFAEALYQQLQSQPGGSGNLFLSPASVSTALAMTYAGAGGATATQMAAALHYTLGPTTLAGDFGSLLADLNSAGQGNYSLSVADALWGQQGYSFLTPFLNLMQADYGGGLHQVDFVNAAAAATQTINNWVAQETNNKIQNLIPSGALTNLTRLVLTNAIYFKGQWETPFNPALTNNAAFTLRSGSQVQTPTMHNTDLYGYMQSDGYQVLELPYAGNRLVMDVLLPTGSGSAGLNISQLPADLNGWLQGMTPQRVAVSLPKFQITTPSFDLTQSLENLGMTDAFNPNTADFSGITDPSSLFISAVYHKAFIDVDESGTEAAAATGGVATATGIEIPITPPIVFNADHPFLFLIRDTQSGSVLFMGQVADPTSTGTDPSAPAVPAAAPVIPDPAPTGPIAVPPIIVHGPVPITPRPIPSNYSITLYYGFQNSTGIAPGSSITSADAPETGFVLSGAPVGASYSFTVTSSGGGTPLTGSGTVGSTAPQDVMGINVARLGNGTLTYAVRVANAAGTGPAVTATTTLDQTAPVGYAIGPPRTITSATAAGVTLFVNDAEVGANYSYTVTSSGGGTPLTGSGVVTTAIETYQPTYPGEIVPDFAIALPAVTGINVSSLPNGTLTFSVTLSNGAGTGAAATATATLDLSSSGSAAASVFMGPMPRGARNSFVDHVLASGGKEWWL